MINPIDKDKVAENPGSLSYPHHIGSVVVKPEDVGKLKSRALSAMHQQTAMHLHQIQQQVELLMDQATAIKKRMEMSEKIYSSAIAFEPFVGQKYHLYNKDGGHRLMMIAPDEWGRSMPPALEFLCTVTLLSDHTWEVL
jgi:hypothetical protein